MEKLVHEIRMIILGYIVQGVDIDGDTTEKLPISKITSMAEEIAKLLTPDVNAKLLEALTELVRLKEWKDRFGKDPYYLCTHPSVWKKANEAIQNAQSK